MISVRFLFYFFNFIFKLYKIVLVLPNIKGKPFNITVIQVYAPTSNAEEGEVECFDED